ncbi:hypothetical protein HY489_02745 [Candidatus Woesearchaeota archaeon]|nr:hypothetical protein [Candidatus Woesearchaeota archaeon]
MNKNLIAAIVCVVLITIITLLSALPFGFRIEQQTAQTLPADQVVPVMDEGQGYYGPTPGPTIHTITFTNTFMPRQYVLPQAQACLYNTKNGQGAYLGTRWQVSSMQSKVDFGDNQNVVQLGKETRTVKLTIDKFVRWKRPIVPQAAMPPEKIPKTTDYPEGFDTIYLWLITKEQSNFYPSCESLQQVDMEYAKKITLV